MVIAGTNAGEPVDAIVVEIQLEQDEAKAWALLFYIASVWRELGCHTWAMLFSPRHAVLVWAQTRLYPRRPELAPLVITPDLIPPITTLEHALSNMARAVLSVVLHGQGPDAVACACATIQAIIQLAPPDIERYLQLVQTSISQDDMQEVRDQVPTQVREHLSEWELESSLYRNGLDKGLEQGLEQGREQGLEQGLEQGRQQGLEQARGVLHETLLQLLQARDIEPDDSTVARIRACTLLDQLQAWIVRAGTVSALDDLFE
ncbi:hypothetical protein [Enhygromyxa salina]|uniref:hypothetical protein n=1 Tax=Enhygromyxa salina TaxID=215803 RepID=UPI0015E5A8DF|nr:hypothetical protein [Enhygromyxa salina]